MIERLDYVSINGPAIASMAKAKNDMASIEDRLRAIIELRVSQINGCAYCVDLHTQEARNSGEPQQRLDCLTVWREVPFFDDAERAALEWGGSCHTHHQERSAGTLIRQPIGAFFRKADCRSDAHHSANECLEPFGNQLCPPAKSEDRVVTRRGPCAPQRGV